MLLRKMVVGVAALLSVAGSSVFAQNPVKLVLPPALYAVPGSELNIYFDNVVLAPDSKSFLFDVDCGKGRQDQARWRFTPGDKDVGSFPLTIKVLDHDSKTLAEASTTVFVSSTDAGKGGNLSIMMVGDSLTDASVYPQELNKLLKSEGNPTVTFIGSHIGGGNPPKDSAACHEGRGGWTWATYCSKWTESGEEAPYRKKSPFLALKDGKPVLDFKAYCDTYNAGKAPDCITIFLGVNDTFNSNDTNIDAVIDKMFESADTLIGEFKRVGPDTKIGLALAPPPAATQDAFGENYRCGQTRWQYRKNQHRLVERMLAKFSGKENEKLFIIPVYVNLDCVNNYPQKEEPVNARNPKKTNRNCNGVHPSTEGYYQIADSFYYWLKYELNRK